MHLESLRAGLAKRPLHLPLAAYCFGLVTAPIGIAGLAVPVSITLLVVLAVMRMRPAIAILTVALFLAGSLVSQARVEELAKSRLRSLHGKQVEIAGWLLTKPKRGEFSSRATIHAREAVLDDGASISLDEKVMARAPNRVGWDDASIGDGVVARAEVSLPKSVESAGDDGNRLDWAEYLRSEGIAVEIELESVQRSGSNRGGLSGAIDSIRARSEEALSLGLDRERSALLQGMVLGQDQSIPASTVEDFRRSGLAHLLAVSGQNVMLLALLVFFLGAVMGLGRNTRLLAVLALIALYIPLTGAGPSIQRAGVMGAAGVVAALAGRRTVRWYSLLLALAVTLSLNPLALKAVGWQLSFVAVIAIFWLAPKIRRKLGSLPRPLAEGLAITVAATVLTLPLMAFHFGRISMVSVLANVLALPAVSMIMWLGMLSASVGQVWLLPAGLLNQVNGVLIGYLAEIASWSARQPFAVFDLQIRSWWLVALIYALIAVTVMASTRLRLIFIRRGRLRLAALSAVCMLLLAGAAAISAGRSGPPSQFTVSFLDVGQGDATLLQTPQGRAVLVDAGPPGAGLADELEAVGVERIDLLIITHAQLDHYGGLAELAASFDIGTIANGGRGSNANEYRDAIARVRLKGAREITLQRGQRLKLDGLNAEVLAPEAAVSTTPEDDPNQSAIVLKASYGGFDMLLPADAESDVWGQAPVGDIEVLKVAHHGSADDGLSDALLSLRPELAVISAGRGNPFGHPHPATVAALRSSGVKVLRTDRDGTIKVSPSTTGISVSSESGAETVVKLR